MSIILSLLLIFQASHFVDEVLDRRLALGMSFSFLCKRTSIISNDAGRVVSDSSYKVYVDQDKYRSDVIGARFGNEANGAVYKHILCRNCEKNGFTISAVTGVGAEKSSFVINFLDQKNSMINDHAKLDWRMIGLESGRFGSYSHANYLSVFKTLSDITKWRIDTIMLSGKTYKHYISIDSPSIIKEYFFDESRGSNPVQIKVSLTDGTARIMSIHNTTIEYQALSAGKFYPSIIRYEVTVLDKMVESETLTFSEINFQSQPAEVFTLKGIQPDEDQVVMMPGVKKITEAPVWRNGQLDWQNTLGKQNQDAFNRMVDKPKVEIEPFPDQKRSPLLYIVGGIAGVLSLLLLVVAYRRRKRG